MGLSNCIKMLLFQATVIIEKASYGLILICSKQSWLLATAVHEKGIAGDRIMMMTPGTDQKCNATESDL